MSSSFHRKDNYTTAIDEVKGFRDVYGNILPIPGEKSIICYYRGLPIVEISDSSWTLFGKDYFKYFSDKQLCTTFSKKSQDEKRTFYIDQKEMIAEAFKKAMPSDKERLSQQDIAMRALCNFDNCGYVICGMETAVPLTLTNGRHVKPEIDLVAINTEKKSILLIEFKCQKSTLLNKNGKDIVSHCRDYFAVKKWIDEDSEHAFINGMLNAYYTMRRIFNIPNGDKLNAEDLDVDIVFLLTNHPSAEKDSEKNKKNNLTKQSYKNAKDRLNKEIGRCADEAYYIAFDRPEDIQELPTDIISEKYKGTDKLVWRWG